MFLTL